MARISRAEILEAYEQDVLRENRKENNGALQLGRKVRLISFESSSNGKNRRKRRHTREVTFIVDASVQGRPVAYQVVDNEIRTSRNRRHLYPDQLAIEVLTDLPVDERSPDNLLERLMMIRKQELKLRGR